MKLLSAVRSARFKGALVLLLAVLSSGYGSNVQAQDGLDDYKLAIGLYKQRRWALAADSLQTFLKEYPQHAKAPYAQLYLGMSLSHQKKYAEARISLRKFVKKFRQNKNLPYGMFRVAECSYFLGELKEAEQEFLAFRKKFPKHELNEWALPNLADVQLRLNKHPAAAANFRAALKGYPQGHMAEDSKFGLARALEALKEYEEAIALYKELASTGNGTFAAQSQMNLATRHFESGEFVEATAQFALLEKKFPKSRLVPLAQLNAGFAQYQLGEFQLAIAEFERAAKNTDQATTAGYWTGLSYKSLGKYEQAAQQLKSAFESDKTGPLAEEAHYQWADCEFRSLRHAAARKLFLDVVASWPKGEWADDALHFAAEAALQEQKLDEADKLIARFNAEYPQSLLIPQHELLTGRLLIAHGGEKNQQQAVTHFQKVLDAGVSGKKTGSLARFYLARTQKRLGRRAEAVKTIAPLAEELMQRQTDSEFLDALILYGNGLLVTKDYAKSAIAISHFLELRSEGKHVDEALSTLALAHAHLGNRRESQASLAQLAKQYPGSGLTAETTRQIAEIAFAAQDWEWAASLFTSLAKLDKDSPHHAAALSGYAWSSYRRQKFREAAVAFGRLLKTHADNLELAPEAAYMRGKSLFDAGDLVAAAAAFSAAFAQFAPEQAKPDDDEKETGYYAYRAGLQAARTLRKLKRTRDADGAYEKLLKHFPQPTDLDKLLDEWALLNYEAKDFDRSDEIFRRLIKDVPDSALVDDARLSLAESEYAAGQLDGAKKAFTLLQADPKTDAAIQDVSLQHLIDIGVTQQQWKEVVTLSKQFRSRFPESNYRHDAQFYSAEAQLHLNDLEVALAILRELQTAKTEEAVRQSDWFPRVWILLAEIFFRKKKYDEVQKTVDELHSTVPDTVLLYQADDILGRSLKNQAKFDDARAAFERVVKDKTGRRTETAAKCQFFIAETYMIQKSYQRAQREYLKVYHLYRFPDWQAPALFQTAVCDEALDQWEQAAQTYEELIKKFPDQRIAEKARTRLPLARKKGSG